MSKKYNFVIARFWDEDECPTETERLCVYTFRKEVQFGTEEEAFNMAESLNCMNVGDIKKYKPYFIDLNQNLVKMDEL